MKTYKKLYKENQHVFKIVFDKRGLIKGDFKRTEDDSDAEDDEDYMPSQEELKKFQPLRGDKTWYFNCKISSELFTAPPLNWIKNIGLRAKASNPACFQVGNTFNSMMESHIRRTKTLAMEIQKLESEEKKAITTDKKPKEEVRKSVIISEDVNIYGKNAQPKESISSEPQSSPQNPKSVQKIDDLMELNINVSKSNFPNELKLDEKNASSDAFKQSQANTYKGIQLTKEEKDEQKRNIETYNFRLSEMKRNYENWEQLGWDLKYQNQFKYLVQSVGDQKRHLKISERFIEHIGKFRRTAI